MVLLNLRCQNRTPSQQAFNVGMAHQKALEVAQKSIVLAKNNGGILPLKNLDDVCLIGALAKDFRYQGGGSSHAGSSPASGTILKEKKPDCSDAVWLFLFLFIARDSRITISAFLKKWF